MCGPHEPSYTVGREPGRLPAFHGRARPGGPGEPFLADVGSRLGSLSFAGSRRSPHASFPHSGRQVPLRRFVCVAPECRRCNQGVGGFQFPFLGPWSRELVCPDLGLSGYEARRALATCRTVMSQEQRVQRSSGVLVTDLIPPPIWRAELNSLRDRAGARIHEVLAAGSKVSSFGRTPWLMCPSSWTRSTGLSGRWRLGSCMLPLRHPRFLCRMPACTFVSPTCPPFDTDLRWSHPCLR